MTQISAARPRGCGGLDLLLLGIGGLYLGGRRGVLRTILSIIALFLAMTFSALIAPLLVGLFVRGSGSYTDPPTAIAFAGLLLAFYAILEVMLRRSFPVTRFAKLETLDNVLGAIFAIAWTLLALALFTQILGYGVYAISGAPGAGLLGGWITSSGLVGFLGDVLHIPINLMRFLFPAGLPQPLRYFAAI